MRTGAWKTLRAGEIRRGAAAVREDASSSAHCLRRRKAFGDEVRWVRMDRHIGVRRSRRLWRLRARNGGPLGSRPRAGSPMGCTTRSGLRPLRPLRRQGQGQQPQATGPAPIVVTVTPVKRADFPVVLQSIGQVQAYNTVLVRARVDGQIMKIAFNEGQMVKQGDLLAQIDPRPFQAALDQAVAKKSQDEANLANAKLDLARFATLAKQDFATKQQLDTQNAMVLQLTASIAADAAAIDAARTQLDYTTIRAPISGRAGFRLIDEGNLVSAGQQTGIVSIAQLQPISVIFAEPQEYVPRINEELAAARPKSRSWTRRATSSRAGACRSATTRSISPPGPSGSRLSSRTRTTRSGQGWR